MRVPIHTAALLSLGILAGCTGEASVPEPSVPVIFATGDAATRADTDLLVTGTTIPAGRSAGVWAWTGSSMDGGADFMSCQEVVNAGTGRLERTEESRERCCTEEQESPLPLK